MTPTSETYIEDGSTYPKVAIIILNWNGKEDTIECLESLKHITYPNYEILLVDNGSMDGSVECFRERYPGMEIIENEENLGFAEGNNVGMRYAFNVLNPDYILLLNNDTVVDKDFLGELVKVIERDERIVFVGPKIYYYYRTDMIFYTGAKINYWFLHSKGGKGEIDKGQFDNLKEVDTLSGCTILLKSTLLKSVGELDPEYFAYYEEIDWCMRAKRAGYKAIYAPKSMIFHKGAGSTGQRFNPIVAYYKTRNLILFMRKNGRMRHWLTFIPYFTLLFVVRSLRAIWHFQPSVIWSMFKGVGWNIKNFLGLAK